MLKKERKLIKKVNILGTEFEVIKDKSINNNDLQLGEIDYFKNTIRIRKDLEKQVAENTLVHEIVHGILFKLGYDNLNLDEGFITAMASGIYQVFKDNDVIKEK